MGRINNAITFGSGFNISAQGPIDSRMRVQYESDLTNAATWPADEAPVYDGMSVVVMETGQTWILKNKEYYQDKTSGNGWIPSGTKYTLPVATENTLGGIKVGNSLYMDASGKLNAYALAVGGLQIAKNDTTHTTTISTIPATRNSKGVVQIGPGLIITSNGLLSVSDSISKYLEFIDIEWADLVDLRLDESLIPGQNYRITDYITTTNGAYNSISAEHSFDIIVTADSPSSLNENARAYYDADRDTYFEDSDLTAWEIKYCLDNDEDRFSWADTDNGTGVIYYMKDEFNNEAGYDFKNLMFKRYKRKYYSDGDSNLENSGLTALDSGWTGTVGYKVVYGGNNYQTAVKNTLNTLAKGFLDYNGYEGFYSTSDYDSECMFDWGYCDTQTHNLARFHYRYNNQNYYLYLISQADSTSYEYFYTFTTSDGNSYDDLSDIYDATVKGGDRSSGSSVMYRNMLPSIIDSDGQHLLLNTVFIAIDADSVYNNRFYGNTYNNTFGNNTYNNIFYKDVSNTVCGVESYENIFFGYVYNLTSDNYFLNNTFNRNINDVHLCKDFYNNTFIQDSSVVTIGDNFNHNYVEGLGDTIIEADCGYNKIYDYQNSVYIKNNFEYNIVLTPFSTGIIIGNSVSYQVFGDGKQISILDLLTEYSAGDGLNLEDGEFSVDIEYVKDAIEESHIKTAQIRLTAWDATSNDHLVAYVTTPVDRYYATATGPDMSSNTVNIDLNIQYDDRNPLVTVCFINRGQDFTHTNVHTGFWFDGADDTCMNANYFTQAWKPSLVAYIPYNFTTHSTPEYNFSFNGSYQGITFQINLKDYTLTTNGRIQLCNVRTSTLCYAEGTLITLVDNSVKAVEDITYNDLLKVWNFDNGKDDFAKPIWIKVEQEANQYALVTLSDGNSIKLVGSDDKYHCMYDVTENKFNHAVDCVGHEVYTENGIVTVESIEFINEPVKFYNIVTNIHLNCYANHILTSTEKNNIYPIKDMKFIKNHKNRKLKSYNEFKEYGISYKDFRGWRLAEQPMSVEECVNMIKQRKETQK